MTFIMVWLKTNCKEIPFKLPLDHAPFFCSASNKLSVVQGPVKKDNLLQSKRTCIQKKREATPKETRSPVGYGDLQLKVVVTAAAAKS